MKSASYLLLIAACLFMKPARSQNLVPNPGFELTTSTCPGGDAIWDEKLVAWKIYFESPDYFNTCIIGPSGNFGGGSQSVWGFQLPFEGNAHFGLRSYTKHFLTGGNNSSFESVIAPIAKMTPGKMYEVSMSVNMADKSGFATNNLGVFFCDSCPVMPVNFGYRADTTIVPQVSFHRYGIITDTINWIRLQGVFLADSAYDNIVVGAFDNKSTLQIIDYHKGAYGYYYIDSVVLKTKDTSFAAFATSVDTVLCTDNIINVKYWGSAQTGNKFILQLSDATGSFASPMALDSVISTTSGTIKAFLPYLTAGNNYKIRIAGTTPAFFSIPKDVIVRYSPIKPVASGTDTLCEGSTLSVSSSASSQGATYKWTGPAGFTFNGSTTYRTNTIPAWSGDYVISTTLNECTSQDTLAVVIHAIPAKPVAGNNSPICVGGDINLSASQVPGASYEWGGPLVYWSPVQNATRTGAQIIHSGKYWVKSVMNGCESLPDTTVVTVVQGPEVLTYANPGDTICEHWDITFVAVPKNAGSSPTYEWYKNGIFTGGTGNNYKTSGVITGDTFYVKMKAGTTCNTAIRSKPIRMTVLPTHTPPIINITATPGTHVWPFVQVTFKAATGNAGINPGYQWKRNGADIPNGQDSILKMTDLKTGDTVCCVVTSNYLCANPRMVQSNCLVMNVDLSVEGVERERERSINIYPNPNAGNFTIESKKQGVLVVTNLQGQFMGKYEIMKGKNFIQLPKGISEGVYVGRINDEVLKITVSR